MAKFKDEDQGGSRPDKKHSTRGLPWIYEPRCSVCKSNHRRAIDQMLVAGFSLGSIAEHFERLGVVFTRSALSRHGTKHLTLHSAAYRRIIEKRAEEMMEDVDDAAGFLTNRRSILEVALQKGYDQLLNGSTPIEPRDLLAIIDKLEKIEAEEHMIQVEEMMLDFKAFSQAVKMLVAEDVWPQIVQQYKLNLDAERKPALELMVINGPTTVEDISAEDVDIEDEE
jgi:hypothetical protein